MPMLDGDLYERVNSMAEVYLSDKLPKDCVHVNMDTQRDGPHNLKIRIKIPGLDKVEVMDSESVIQPYLKEGNQFHAFQGLIDRTADVVRSMQNELGECHGVIRKKEKKFIIPSMEALSKVLYISIVPQTCMDLLSHYDAKQVAEGSNLYAAVGHRFWDEGEGKIRHGFLPKQYIETTGYTQDEMWRLAAQVTIPHVKPEVNPFSMRSLDPNIISDEDVYYTASAWNLASGCIAIPGFLEGVADRLKHNLWVIPISTYDTWFFMEGERYPCSMQSVDRLRNWCTDNCSKTYEGWVLPYGAVLHYDRAAGKLETGDKYVQRALNNSITFNNGYQIDFDSIFRPSGRHI